MAKAKKPPRIRGKKVTVGNLKKLIADAGLPDDAEIFPDWGNGPPGEYEPGVKLVGFTVGDNHGKPYLSTLVDLSPLET